MTMGWLRSKKFLLIVAVGLLIALLISTLPLKEWSVNVRDWLRLLGPWSLPTFILLYILTTTLCLPNIVLILIAGTVFGLVGGIISTSIADTLGAIICFGLGRTIARTYVKKLMTRYPTFAQLDRAVGEKGWKILLLSRLSPLFPSNILNYGFSCTKIVFWQFLLFTWLGMLPVIGFYVYIGYFGVTIAAGSSKPEVLASQIGGLVATVIAAIYVTRLAKKILSQAKTQNITNP